MAVQASLKVSDEKLKRKLEKLSLAHQRIKGYDVGFFKSATYTNGIFVAMIAAINEFGATNRKQVKIPARPFFSQANKTVSHKLVKLVDTHLTEENGYTLSKAAVEQMGATHQGEIQHTIKKLREPPNAPATIAAKGSTNPLVHSGVMRRSVTYTVIL